MRRSCADSFIVRTLSTHVHHVRLEHHRHAIGIGASQPRISWRVDTDDSNWRQAGYEVEVEGADGDTQSSGRIASRESVLVPWFGAPLASRSRCRVRVRVWGTSDPTPSEWSEPAAVEAGLLSPTDWHAALVLPAPPSEPDEQPSWLLRRRFLLDRQVVRARLYITAHGVFEASINGTRVGNEVLAPGWTSYHRRLRYATYDVTDLLRQGDNVIGAEVADGWFRGHLGFGGQRAHYGERTGVITQLEVEFDDRTTSRVCSDGDWRSSPGAVRRADLYDGETHDLRLEQDGWSTPEFDDVGWTPVDVERFDPAALVAPTGPPVRRIETIPPSAIFRSPSGALLVDFGVNVVGRVRLRLPHADAGTEITVRHAEVLDAGELGTRPLRAARATDVVILAGD